MSPSSPLQDFASSVQNDPEQRARFQADPTGTMTAAGLSAEDQAVVQTKDPAQVQAAIQKQTGSPSVVPLDLW